MNRVLVDTNILSYRFKRHSLAYKYDQHIVGKQAFIAAQTVAEMRFGALNDNWGQKRKSSLEAFLAQFTTLYPNDVICTLWAEVSDIGFRLGRPINAADAWIAATALALGAPLVTHNAKDFDFIPQLEIISERG